MGSEPTPVPPALARLLANMERSAQRREAAAPDIARAEADKICGCDGAMSAARRLRDGARAHLVACGVDERSASFAVAPDETGAIAWLRGWMCRAKPFAILRGGFGTGKSVAAAWSLLQARRWVRTMAHPLANEPVAFQEYDHRRGFWVTAAKLRYAPRYVEGKATPLLDRAAMADWLALDELRACDAEGEGLKRLEEVLGERYAMSRRTVITTNLTMAELKAAMGERLGSRMFEEAEMFDSGSELE